MPTIPSIRTHGVMFAIDGVGGPLHADEQLVHDLQQYLLNRAIETNQFLAFYMSLTTSPLGVRSRRGCLVGKVGVPADSEGGAG
jgi:hypothetical protein